MAVQCFVFVQSTKLGNNYTSINGSAPLVSPKGLSLGMLCVVSECVTKTCIVNKCIALYYVRSLSPKGIAFIIGTHSYYTLVQCMKC